MLHLSGLGLPVLCSPTLMIVPGGDSRACSAPGYSSDVTWFTQPDFKQKEQETAALRAAFQQLVPQLNTVPDQLVECV